MTKKNTQNYFFLCFNEKYAELIDNWLGVNLDRHYEDWQGLIHKGSRENGYLLTFPVGDHEKVFLKCFGIRESKRRLPFLKFLREGYYAFMMARTLYKRGLPTPEPVAYACFKKGLNAGRELVFTLWIDSAMPLGNFTHHFFSQQRDLQWRAIKRELAVVLGRFVKNIHEQGVYHGDFNINNILVRYKDGLEVFLIDTGEIRTVHWISHRRVVKNLDEINRFFLDTDVVTRTDRLRFLIAYLGKRAQNRELLRRYWHEIEARTLLRLKIHKKAFISAKRGE